MSQQNIKHAEDIFSLAKGGVVEIAYRLGCHTRTIERWPKCGIPDKYWDKLHEHYGVTPYECFRLNAKIRGYRA